jgi:thiosulfate/3-mercaptopyruvate sulfurtransferase
VQRETLLTTTDGLEAQLGDPRLRIFDCTVVIELGPDGVAFRSGRESWEQAHIPGAGFLDLLEELAAPHTAFHFMLPAAEQFARVLGSHGVGDGARVVLYDSQNGSWAARTWWMLRGYGFDDATVLDGGWTKWTLEGRPTSTAPPVDPPAAFTPRPRPGVFVDRDAVLDAIGDERACLINALPEALHRGEGPALAGRRQGHIPGSGNVPAETLVDPQTRAFLPERELRAALTRAGALDADHVITYCGGGIAASGVAFALRLLGHEDVAVYDASLEEWATDPSLPLTVD